MYSSSPPSRGPNSRAETFPEISADSRSKTVSVMNISLPSCISQSLNADNVVRRARSLGNPLLPVESSGKAMLSHPRSRARSSDLVTQFRSVSTSPSVPPTQNGPTV